MYVHDYDDDDDDDDALALWRKCVPQAHTGFWYWIEQFWLNYPSVAYTDDLSIYEHIASAAHTAVILRFESASVNFSCPWHTIYCET